MRTSVLGVLVAASLLAGQASALGIETAYTITQPPTLSITAGGTTATINPVDPLFINNDLIGLPGFIDCLAGTCDIVNQDWLVFSVTVTGSGSLNDFGLGLLSSPALSALGMGYFLQGNPIQDGSGLTDDYNGSLAVATTPTFNFVANGGGAGLTGTSLVLFVAYADNVMPYDTTGTPWEAFGTNAVNFMATEYGTAETSSGFTYGNFETGAQVVPEPGTALLLGLGFVALGVHGRRRRS